MMLDARGNLDLESPEEILTSSGTLGPSAPWRPFGSIAFGRFIFRDVFSYSFLCIFDGIWLPFWHVGVIFHVFCITFSGIDLHGFIIKFCKESYICFEIFCWFPWSYIQMAKPSKTLAFTLLLHGLHFRKHMFFYNCRDMFRCSLFASFVVKLCTNDSVILIWFWHKSWRFFRYRISNCFLVCFSTPFGT